MSHFTDHFLQGPLHQRFKFTAKIVSCGNGFQLLQSLLQFIFECSCLQSGGEGIALQCSFAHLLFCRIAISGECIAEDWQQGSGQQQRYEEADKQQGAA